MLLSRMQNINISSNTNPAEFWVVRDVTTTRKFTDPAFNAVEQEDELYVKGNSLIWTQGLASEEGHAMPRVVLTCETPIKFAFFCPPSFITFTNSGGQLDQDPSNYGVGLLDANSLRVYFKNGEDYMTAIENPISKVWVSRQSLILEKDSACTQIGEATVPMPRFFSLTHPLNEMCPLLIKNIAGISYIVEADYRIIFASPETDLILMFDLRIGKHFVCRLRRCTTEEINQVAVIPDTTCNSSINLTSNTGFHNISSFHSMKSSSFAKPSNTSSMYRNMSMNATSSPYRSNVSTPQQHAPSTR